MINSKAPRRTAAALFVAAIVLAGCSAGGAKNQGPGPAAQGTGLLPQQARITDESSFADRQTLDGVQQRLRKLNEAGIPQGNYALAKAQCWLDTAKSQYHENDRSGYIEESLSEAVKITQALEADKSAPAGLDTPLVARSSKLRDDLWAQMAAFKAQPSTMVCNAKTVACAEVRLVRAGHAEQQTGWRQATPHIQMVEDALRIAKIEADNCTQQGKPVVVVTGAAAGMTPAAPRQNIVGKETYVLLTDTLFKFDKSAVEDMLPGGQQRLADVARRLKDYKSIQTMTVIGYTDRLGTDDYNDKLSAARARSVQEYLQALGVKPATVVVQGKGELDPASRDCSASASRDKQIICLQSDRRVTIEITGAAK